MKTALPKNILVADLDESRGLHTALVIKRLEYNVFAAANGDDLLRITNRIIPQLILLDIRMSLTGRENCLDMLRSDSLFKMIRVVAVADGNDRKLLEESLKRGANAYLVRHLDPVSLYSTVQTLTETRPRRVPRLRVIFKVLLHTGEERRIKFATMISEQGVFIRTVDPLHAGTATRLTLELPSESPLTLDGEVIYSRACDKDAFLEPGMGIKFVNLTDKLKKEIKNFIEDQLSVDIDRETLI